MRVNVFLAGESDYVRYNAVYREFFPGKLPSRCTVIAQMNGGFIIEIDIVTMADDVSY